MRPEEALDRPEFRTLRVAAETAQAALFVITMSVTAGSIAWAWLSHAGGRADAARWAAAGGWGLAAAALVGAGYVAGRGRRSRDPDDYVIEQLEGMLTVSGVDDHQRYDYVRRQRVRATRGGFRLVPIRSHWSARSRYPSSPECLFADQILFDGGTPEEDGRVRRWIYLHRPIGKGYRVWVGLRQTFTDDGGRMQPYYRESGEERQLDRLTVRLRFAADRVPLEVVGVRWSARSLSTRQEDGEIARREIAGPDGSVEYVVDIHRPDRHCAYGLRWRWAEQDPAASPENGESHVPARLTERKPTPRPAAGAVPVAVPAQAATLLGQQSAPGGGRRITRRRGSERW